MVTHDGAIDANDVVDRMRQVTGTTTDIALGALFQMGTSAVSTWRRRNTVPYAECVTLAVTRGVSLDWLILGLGVAMPTSPGSAQGLAQPLANGLEDPRIMRMARFLRAWQVGRDADDVAWLERTLARTVPEYAEWLSANKLKDDRGRES